MAFLSDFGAPLFGVLSVSVTFLHYFYECFSYIFTVLAERFYFGEILQEGFIVLALWRCGKPKFYLF